MNADLIRIGKARGIRIPEEVIEQCGFDQRVEMRIEGGSLVITPGKPARSGWEKAFKAMARRRDDAAVLPDDLACRFDETVWEW